ncbi:signal peptidase I [Novosphingobium umbonatum]|uniref:Signal peptidase I n=1 Tax=Novosphingobium umbonatum TaxID=1908524 RepID=A0A3S2UPH0_9SPHN|nr:signal peptidase I [Novosphingobium umbonatum]RVU03542.1 signal peptidase I [Novosphingobium umbonatum]
MTDTAPGADDTNPALNAAGTPAPAAGKKPQEEENFFVFLVKLVLIVGIFRSFFFSPFNIPSESMLPRLVNGDYLLAAKWPYGYSQYSLPLSLPLIPGRIFASQPQRGDVVIFKAPPANHDDWIKRVIGLPGDTIQMKGGVLYINGNAMPKQRIEDFEIAVSANTHCYEPRYGLAVNYEVKKADGSKVCHYPQFKETLPSDGGKPGKSYNVIDMEPTPQDNTLPYIVPEGALFLMGDDRDNSMDSRFSTDVGGIGYVPQGNLVGRATIMMWSTDGSSNWLLPWTWFTAARLNRIGGTF